MEIINIKVALSSKTSGACEWLQLPATEDELNEVLTIINATSADDVEIYDVSSNLSCINYAEHSYSNINELNYLANLVDDMSEYQINEFEKVAEYMGEYDHSDINVADLINCLFCLDDVVILGGVSSYYDLGKYYIEECEGIDDSYLRDKLGAIADYINIDYEKYGDEYYDSVEGGFVGDDWVEFPCGISSCYEGNIDDIQTDYIILYPDWEPEDNSEDRIKEKALKIDELLFV